VIITTARSDGLSRVSGIRAGADVYLVKPVLPEEIVLLVHNLMRRLRGQASSTWTLDSTGWRLLSPDGHAMKLTHSEHAILLRLSQNSGQAVSREELATSLGHNPEYYDYRRLEILIRRLRNKARDNLNILIPLETAHRHGYAFTASIELVKN
jgi:two-component system OmpR family response regulator